MILHVGHHDTHTHTICYKVLIQSTGSIRFGNCISKAFYALEFPPAKKKYVWKLGFGGKEKSTRDGSNARIYNNIKAAMRVV